MRQEASQTVGGLKGRTTRSEGEAMRSVTDEVTLMDL